MLLIYIEHQSGNIIGKGSKSAISAALEWKKNSGEEVVGLLLGSSGMEIAANEAAEYGLDRIYYSELAGFSHFLSTTFAAAIFEAIEKVDAKRVCALSSATGKDVIPRVAALMEAGQVSDVIGIRGEKEFKRPVFAGDLIADVEVCTEKLAFTVRGTAFDVAEKTGISCPVEKLDLNDEVLGSSFVSFAKSGKGRPSLTEAEVIISGGRAFKSEENFKKYLEPLADILGAAIGASRAAVDSGYAPNDWQIGQTGKIVAPELYIAVGISGAIQHIAGIKDSKIIVAINQDPEAPIFDIADYGLVGDLFEILPELTDALK